MSLRLKVRSEDPFLSEIYQCVGRIVHRHQHVRPVSRRRLYRLPRAHVSIPTLAAASAIAR